MKKLRIPKIDRQDRVKCVLLAILGIAVEFVSLLCFSSGISGAVIVAVILLAASGAIGYFVTKRVILSALSIASGSVLIILGIALFFLVESISGVLLVLSVGLGYLSSFLALIILGGLLALAGRKIYVAIHRKRYGFDPADDFEDFSEEEEPSEDERKNIRHTNSLVCFLFFIAILALNFLVFLLSIERAIEPLEPGGWFSQILELVLINFVMTVLFLVLAIAIKLIFKKKIKVSILILCALIIPSLQTWGSFRAFDYGGILHSTIEEGGMFYQVCRLRNSTARTERMISNDDTFTKIEAKAYGRGSNFGCSLDYENREDETVTVIMNVQDRHLTIEVQDTGIGIADIEQAMEPAFSTKEEHMGLGFVFMQTFMDNIEVFSEPGRGTTVVMKKQLPAMETQMSEVG